MDPKRTKLLGSVIAASALVLALGAAPMIGFGADHLDAPNLTAPSMRPDADINDVYAFPGNNEKRTVIAVTTHPAAGAIAPLEFAAESAVSNLTRHSLPREHQLHLVAQIASGLLEAPDERARIQARRLSALFRPVR